MCVLCQFRISNLVPCFSVRMQVSISAKSRFTVLIGYLQRSSHQPARVCDCTGGRGLEALGPWRGSARLGCVQYKQEHLQ